MSQTLRELHGLVADALAATNNEPLLEPLGDRDHLPEFLDSLVLAVMVTLIEERWNIVVEDDEMVAETFENLETLAAFVDGKRAGA